MHFCTVVFPQYVTNWGQFIENCIFYLDIAGGFKMQFLVMGYKKFITCLPDIRLNGPRVKTNNFS